MYLSFKLKALRLHFDSNIAFVRWLSKFDARTWHDDQVVLTFSQLLPGNKLG